jgi:hypothetical protein
MSRDGSRRVRGITPPGDIHHRALRWNAELDLWEELVFVSPNRDAKTDASLDLLGNNRATYRFGRAIGLSKPDGIFYPVRNVLCVVRIQRGDILLIF